MTIEEFSNSYPLAPYEVAKLFVDIHNYWEQKKNQVTEDMRAFRAFMSPRIPQNFLGNEIWQAAHIQIGPEQDALFSYVWNNIDKSLLVLQNLAKMDWQTAAIFSALCYWPMYYAFQGIFGNYDAIDPYLYERVAVPKELLFSQDIKVVRDYGNGDFEIKILDKNQTDAIAYYTWFWDTEAPPSNEKIIYKNKPWVWSYDAAKEYFQNVFPQSVFDAIPIVRKFMVAEKDIGQYLPTIQSFQQQQAERIQNAINQGEILINSAENSAAEAERDARQLIIENEISNDRALDQMRLIALSIIQKNA